MYLVEHWLSSTAASGKVSSQHSNGHEHENISEKRVWSLGKRADHVVPYEIDEGTTQPILYKLNRG